MMDLNFNKSLATGYHSGSQISRVLTEDWMERNMFCPVCGAPVLGRKPAFLGRLDIKNSSLGPLYGEEEQTNRNSLRINKNIVTMNTHIADTLQQRWEASTLPFRDFEKFLSF